MKIMFYDAHADNNNIAAWELGKDGVTITGEHPVYIDVDFKTLNFQRKYRTASDDAGFLDLDFLSASHFCRHPSSGDSINYKLVLSLTKKLFSKDGPASYHLYRYRQNDEGKIVAKYVGKVPVDGKDCRVVHSLGATENYIILPRTSLYVEFNDQVDISQNIKFSKDKPTYFDVVSMKDDRTRQTFTFEASQFQHLINSYERHNGLGEVEVVIDYPTYANVDDFPDKNIFEILNTENLVNPDFSYKENWGMKFTIRRYILNLDTGKGALYNYPELWSPEYLQVEFPYINDAYRGLPYCYVYLHAWNHDAHHAMGLVKVDVCKGTSIGWQEVNKFPTEPVFAARPGATLEDDGVIMSPVYDAAANSTEFYIWDAKTLQVVSIVSTPINVPYTLHGIWIKGV